MTRDAEMPARDYVAMVLAGIGGETDIGVVQSLLRQVQSAITQFASPAWAPTGRAQLADAAHGRRCSPPSRAATCSWPGRGRSARWPAPRSRWRCCAGCSTARAEVPGLSVDTDLRWHLLLRLVALGVAGDAEIDAELERDRDLRRRAARGDRPGAAADPRGQGRGLAARRRGRVDPQRRARRGHRRLRPPRAARAAAGVGRAVLRGRRPGVGDARPRRSRRTSRSGSTRRCWSTRPSSSAPTPTWRRTTCSRRSRGCCSRAATASPARCGPASATPPRTDAARLVPHQRHPRRRRTSPRRDEPPPAPARAALAGASAGPSQRGRRGRRAACRRGAP